MPASQLQAGRETSLAKLRKERRRATTRRSLHEVATGKQLWQNANLGDC